MCPFFFRFVSHLGCYIILSRVPCAPLLGWPKSWFGFRPSLKAASRLTRMTFLANLLTYSWTNIFLSQQLMHCPRQGNLSTFEQLHFPAVRPFFATCSLPVREGRRGVLKTKKTLSERDQVWSQPQEKREQTLRTQPELMDGEGDLAYQ